MISVRYLDPYICHQRNSVRDALARLNATEHLFQLIVDDSGKLIGTLTDGDVRRALLAGKSLDDPVADSMHVDFVAGRAGADDGNRALLSARSRAVTFIPILNDNDRPCEVLVRDGGDDAIAHALVMAGGFGRRLGARTKDTPKPLLPVAGKPILEHVLEGLEQAGIGNIHISVHYLADRIKRYIEERNGGADITFLEEDAPLGTAGALAHLADRIDGPVLVLNGDVVTNADVAALHTFHIRHGYDATIGVARYDVEVPFGIVQCSEDGLFEGIEEKPKISNFIAAGLYYLSPEFVALVPSGKPIDMPELLNMGRKIGLRIGLFPIHEFWTDVGRPDDLDAVDKHLSEIRSAADRR